MRKCNYVFSKLSGISSLLFLLSFLGVLISLILLFRTGEKEICGGLIVIFSSLCIFLIILTAIFLGLSDYNFKPTKKERLENLELRVNILEKEQLYGKKNKR